MTVSEIRSLMLEKVIPESLLPQNIAVCLMDENAAPPELDAFTFLNRLRSLGIGSALPRKRSRKSSSTRI